MESAGLEVSGLRVQRDGRTVFEDVSLAVSAASSLAVTGPSGVGKTTLLDVIAGILAPDAGQIVFNGFKVTSATRQQAAAWRLRHVGVVHQFAELLPELSLAENAQLPLLLAGFGAQESCRRAEWALDAVGIGALAGAFPSQVSGGERQRAAIARAVVHRPALILADEPTGALDVQNAHTAARVLIDATASVGATLVMATHNLQIADLLECRLELADASRVVAS